MNFHPWNLNFIYLIIINLFVCNYLLDIEKDPFSLVNKSRSLELTESIEEVEYSPGESRHSFIMNNNIYHYPQTLITMASSFLTKLFRLENMYRVFANSVLPKLIQNVKGKGFACHIEINIICTYIWCSTFSKFRK